MRKWHIVPMRRPTRPKAVIRPLDPADPASWDHPSHDEQWLELARAMGRTAARREWKRLHGDQDVKTSSAIRAVFERPAKRSLDRRSDRGLPNAGKPRRPKDRQDV